jgi:hypothetical protein
MIAGIVCLKAIDQSGQHYNTRERFRTGFLLASFPNRPRPRRRPYGSAEVIH